MDSIWLPLGSRSALPKYDFGACHDSFCVFRERVRRAVVMVGSASRVWVSPDCGMGQLAPDVARAKLAVMVDAVQDVRATL